jgi:hypothetical protein
VGLERGEGRGRKQSGGLRNKSTSLHNLADLWSPVRRWVRGEAVGRMRGYAVTGRGRFFGLLIFGPLEGLFDC